MAQPASLSARALVAGLDDWGEAVAAAAPRYVGDPRLAALQVIVASELPDAARTDAMLDLEGALLGAAEVPYLPVIQAVDGVWIGPLVVPTVAGCERCARERRRRDGIALIGLADDRERGPRGDRSGDVQLAAGALVAVVGWLSGGSLTARSVARRFREPGVAPAVGRVDPVASCDRCDARVAEGASGGGWRSRGATVSALADHLPSGATA